MKYTITDLRRDFPDDDACLLYIFKERFPRLRGYKRVKGRKAFFNKKGKQIYPLAGTIFEKSKTPLTLWFHAIFLFASSKNGVSAAELRRQLGVTEKCAWSMGHKIRSLMKQGTGKLKGIVEADETYFGGRHRRREGFRKKQGLMGMVERGGRIRVTPIEARENHILLRNVQKHVHPKARMMTDEAHAYRRLPALGYQWGHVKHGKKHWVRGDIHVNTIEGFWGHLKPAIKGTHRYVSKKYLPLYVDERVWMYNNRKSKTPLFYALLERV